MGPVVVAMVRGAMVSQFALLVCFNWVLKGSDVVDEASMESAQEVGSASTSASTLSVGS
jgi:hypothetical protein